jgi:hypothetical protein
MRLWGGVTHAIRSHLTSGGLFILPTWYAYSNDDYACRTFTSKRNLGQRRGL